MLGLGRVWARIFGVGVGFVWVWKVRYRSLLQGYCKERQRSTLAPLQFLPPQNLSRQEGFKCSHTRIGNDGIPRPKMHLHQAHFSYEQQLRRVNNKGSIVISLEKQKSW